uniref:Putative secreted protein n=1 Tax=Anopheles marajoara TaxID=58244 RepID=A0A2M4CFP0_9DIPT
MLPAKLGTLCGTLRIAVMAASSVASFTRVVFCFRKEFLPFAIDLHAARIYSGAKGLEDRKHKQEVY